MRSNKFLKLIIAFVLFAMLFMVASAFAQAAGPSGVQTPATGVTAAAGVGKLLAIAGIVFTLLQGLKAAFPQITGPIALALNIVLSILSVIVAVKPDQLLSLNTLFLVLTAVSTAAGFHGTWSKLGSGS